MTTTSSPLDALLTAVSRLHGAAALQAVPVPAGAAYRIVAALAGDATRRVCATRAPTTRPGIASRFTRGKGRQRDGARTQ